MYNILIVDDEPELLEILSAAFKRDDEFNVVTASNGSQAYVKTRNQTFDLICTDYNMPQASGIDLLYSLRGNRANVETPIIFFTGYAGEIQDRIKTYKNVALIEKGASMDMLVEAARRLLVKHKSSQRAIVDVALVNYFIEATTKVFEVSSKAKNIVTEKSFVYEKGTHLSVDISGFIGLVSKQISGTLALSFPTGTFLSVISRMLNEPYHQILPEIQEAAGELANIICGQVISQLSLEGYNFMPSMPTVVVGENHCVTTLSQSPTVVIPFNSELGKFYLSLCIKKE